jgi:type IV pilus assembly protein PilQ
MPITHRHAARRPKLPRALFWSAPILLAAICLAPVVAQLAPAKRGAPPSPTMMRFAQVSEVENRAGWSPEPSMPAIAPADGGIAPVAPVQPLPQALLEEEPVFAQPPPPADPPRPGETGGNRQSIPFAGGAGSGEVNVTSREGRLSIIVRDAPLDRVLSILAQTQQLNIVAGQRIESRLSITLRDVPLEDALTSMLSVAGYTWARHKDIIHVTSVSGSTSLAPETQGRRVMVIPLDYASASDLEPVIRGLLSPVGKSFVTISSPIDNRKTREMLVVEDLPPYLDRIRQYAEQADRAPRQVLIEAYVLQVDLKDENRHGVNINYLADVAGKTINIKTTGFANSASPQAFFFSIDGSELTALLEALKTTTDAKTLASPRLLVVNGQEARIQVGEQLGFRVTTTTETSTLESVNFLDVGVVLSVTPRISRTGDVLMKVKPEVSSGQVNPVTGLPEEETTHVDTSVLLANGQGMVIGGLIKEENSDTQNKVHGLGDSWPFGRLFQRRLYSKTRSEIIIALIPRVVPYAADYQAVEDTHYARASTPLLYGPLCPVPRPWEPSLYDAVNNPRTLARLPAPCCDGRGCRRCSTYCSTVPSYHDAIPAPPGLPVHSVGARPPAPQPVRSAEAAPRRDERSAGRPETARPGWWPF